MGDGKGLAGREGEETAVRGRRKAFGDFCGRPLSDVHCNRTGWPGRAEVSWAARMTGMPLTITSLKPVA